MGRKECDARYREKHRAERIAYMEKYNSEHREEYRSRYAERREVALEYQREYQKRNSLALSAKRALRESGVKSPFPETLVNLKANHLMLMREIKIRKEC